jgi:hypothetical protein
MTIFWRIWRISRFLLPVLPEPSRGQGSRPPPPWNGWPVLSIQPRSSAFGTRNPACQTFSVVRRGQEPPFSCNNLSVSRFASISFNTAPEARPVQVLDWLRCRPPEHNHAKMIPTPLEATNPGQLLQRDTERRRPFQRFDFNLFNRFKVFNASDVPQP